MANQAGSPIWYELMTPDPDGATRFYGDVVGWTVDAEADDAVDYRMIGAPGGLVGGMLRLTEDMTAGGATPAWLVYIEVADADETVGTARGLGASVLVPPRDIPGIGRFSLLTDPQGAPFYIMRSARAATSEAFAPGAPGKCGWNEICSPDVAKAVAFYSAMFGWENRETLDMGPMGGYHFLHSGDVRVGAAAEMKDARAHWNLYFNVPGIEDALARVRAGGGSVRVGPHDVPGGSRIALCTDPQGAGFALVQPGR